MEAGKLQWRRQRISGAGQTARRAVQGRIASARKADCVIAPKAPHRAKATICDPAERSQIERRSSGMSKPCRWRQGAGEGELPRRGKRGWPGPYGACDDAGGGTAKPCRRGCGLMGLFCAEITAQTRRGDPCGRPEADSRTRKRATARVAPTGSCRSTDHCTKSDPTTPQSAPPTAPLAQGSHSEGAGREWARGRRRAVGRDDLIPPPCRLRAGENKNTCHPELVEGSGRLRYGVVFLRRWNRTKDYRNREDPSTRLRSLRMTG